MYSEFNFVKQTENTTKFFNLSDYLIDYTLSIISDNQLWKKDLRLEIPDTGNALGVGIRVPSVSGFWFLGIRFVPGLSKCCSAEAEVYQLTQDILVIICRM